MKLLRRTRLARKNRLTAKAGLKRSKPMRVKRNGGPKKRFRDGVLERAKGKCARCAKSLPNTMLDAHHLLPLGRGGSNELTNGVALCRRCHSAVHDHTAPDWRRWLKTGRSA